ncbi:hypothetical protein ALC62_14072 [Cyphomyrmex costatus]|uniref:Uncharacterized protein n=1 Tax=Cyphomyrmex costatus TaxID=456900 RepID=A0A195C2U8_9HYME|nr:hypothetical protein ALC62_14072 [Cyphomyrmex costatus]
MWFSIIRNYGSNGTFVEVSSDGAMVSSNHNPKIGSLSSSADIINLIDSTHLLLEDAFVLFLMNVTALCNAVAVDKISSGAGSGTATITSELASIDTSSKRALIKFNAWDANATDNTPNPCCLVTKLCLIVCASEAFAGGNFEFFITETRAISSADVSKDCPVHSARIGSSSCFVVKTVDVVSPDCACCCGNLSTRYASSTLHA